MFSWEYPPLVVGGIAAHVDGLARAMHRAGHEVVVCSLHHPGEPEDSVVDGVRVLRADIALPWLPDDDLVARMASANHQLVQLIAQLGDWRPDIIHAHDWMVAWAGDTVKTLLGVPLVATIHATERGRHGGHLPPGLTGSRPNAGTRVAARYRADPTRPLNRSSSPGAASSTRRVFTCWPAPSANFATGCPVFAA